MIANEEMELHNYLNEYIEYVKVNIPSVKKLRNEHNKTTGDCIIFSTFGTTSLAYV